MAARSALLVNIGAALVFALALTLLGLAWLDMFGYWQFLASLRNL